MTDEEFSFRTSHEELLIKVSKESDALRAVVELHKPEHSIRGYRCTFDDEEFPCTHQRAIEKELV
jgi:hypothetical protein